LFNWKGSSEYTDTKTYIHSDTNKANMHDFIEFHHSLLEVN